MKEEKRNLAKALKQLEEKMGELEKTSIENDEGIGGIEEEKREAIRQLYMARLSPEPMRLYQGNALKVRMPIAT